MDCTDAHRQALMREFSSTASSAPTSTSAPSQRQAADADGENSAAMVLAEDATVVDGEVIDQRGSAAR